MRSAINLGLGILIAAAVPGLRAQTANPMTTITGAKSALGDKGQAAQQPKPATQAPAKPAPAKPAGQAAAKGQAKPSATPAEPTASAQAKPGAKPGAKPARKARVAKAKPPVKVVEKPATPGGAP